MPEPELATRRRKLLNLRRDRYDHSAYGRSGVGIGLTYGMSAFGYPAGPIAGVQTPAVDPPVSPDQFGAGVAPTDSGTAAAADSGGAPA